MPTERIWSETNALEIRVGDVKYQQKRPLKNVDFLRKLQTTLLENAPALINSQACRGLR